MQYIHAELKQLISDSKEIAKHYHRHLYKSNEIVQLKTKDKEFEGIVKGVNENGMLIVHHHEKDEHFKAGEIEWTNG